MSYVYFIQSGANGPIKIGTALNVVTRLQLLQTGSPEPLRILATRSGGIAEERALHTDLRACWLRGEWFHPEPAVLVEVAASTPYVTPSRYDGPAGTYRGALGQYLETVLQSEFAAAIGKRQASVSRYVTGERFPDADTAREIDKHSGGAVPFSLWQAEMLRKLGIAA